MEHNEVNYKEEMFRINRAIDGLTGIKDHIGIFLKRANYEGQGETDEREWKEDVEMAVKALEEKKERLMWSRPCKR